MSISLYRVLCTYPFSARSKKIPEKENFFEDKFIWCLNYHK